MPKYRRLDNNQIVEVDDFSLHMSRDCQGVITLPCGAQAKCVEKIEFEKAPRRLEVNPDIDPPSDTLGFTPHQLGEMIDHRNKTGQKGRIEFVKERGVPFYQVHASSRRAKLAYMKSRGLADTNPSSGAAIGSKGLADAAELVNRVHGEQANG